MIRKEDKNNVVRSFQRFLKKQVKYKPNPDFNLPREYQCEKYAVVEGRDDKKPDRLDNIVFVDCMSNADYILEWNYSYYQIVVDLESMEIVKEKYRPRMPGDKWWNEDR